MGNVFRAVSPMTEVEIEDHADALRGIFGFDKSGRIAMVRLLELFEEWLPDYIFHVLPDEEMPGLDGFTGNEDCEICLSESTYFALNQGDPHARHTAAHELGHLLLHCKMPTAFAFRSSYDRKVDPEWQADHFADVFLMPAEGVGVCQSVEEVAEKYSVPLERARIRVNELVRKQRAAAEIQGELFQ